jgi:thiamine-monophosphate kinase
MTQPIEHVALGSGREFDLVRTLLRRWQGAAQGIGDDAAILDVPEQERLVSSTDVAVEGVHFVREWFTPAQVADRAVTAALSDLAAMAARPLGILVGLVLPARWGDALDLLADGIASAAGRAETHVIGGDLSAGAELTLAITVLGSARVPVTRSGARSGDHLYMTGRLGGPGEALRALTKGEAVSPWSWARFAAPVARLREAQWLASHGATAMIDISDGLSAELNHLAAASRASMAIEVEQVPVGNGIEALKAVASGEEYELLCAAPANLDTADFERRFEIPLTRIGRVTSQGSPGVLATLYGNRVDLAPGHDHFSR